MRERKEEGRKGNGTRGEGNINKQNKNEKSKFNAKESRIPRIYFDQSTTYC
jgi:hypothetical protein